MLITPSEFIDFISRVATFFYWAKFSVFLICVIAIAALIAPKGKRWWIVTLTIVICSAGYLIPDIMKVRERQAVVKKERNKAVSRYQTAKALFDEKCKTAGEKIYRTVDDVEGVALLRMPKPYKNAYSYDPMWEEAALRLRTEYIYSFLGTTFPNYTHETFLIKSKQRNPNDIEPFVKNPIFGYSFVDVKETNGYMRYKLPWESDDTVKASLQTTPARYAVTYEANVNSEERKHWIANATIKIMDTKDNSLMAEKIIYVFDHGLGAGAERKSGRQPWSHAKKCPQDKIMDNEARFFAEKVLKPKQPNFNRNNGE